MDSPLIRRPRPDDDAALLTVDSVAFGWTPPEDGFRSAWQYAHAEPYAWCAEVDGAPVGKTAAFPMETTLPGGRSIRTPGVTSVAVLPTHRRRGLLRALLTRQLSEMAAAGEPATVLTASEGSIYGRFGFGVTTLYARIEVNRPEVEFLPTAPTAGVSMELVELSRAGDVLPGLHEAMRSRTPGMTTRPDLIWDDLVADREHDRRGMSKLFSVLAREASGTPVGAVGWRVGSQPSGVQVPAAPVKVEFLIAADPAVRMDLWRFVSDLDLTGVVTAYVPVDEALPWALVDRNAVAIRALSDWTWTRILDLAAVVEARSYPVDGEMVIGVVDDLFEANDGAWSLEVHDGRARVEPSRAEPVVTAAVDSWASLLMGTVSPPVLAAAGRLSGEPDSVDRLARMLAWPTAPFNDVMF